MRHKFSLVLILLAGLAACDNAQDRERAHFERGVELFEAKDYARAQLELKNAAKLNPKNAMAFQYLGRIYEIQKQWPEAYAAYGEAIAKRPELVDAALGLGRIEIMGGKFGDALGRAEKVIAATSGNADAHALRAAALLKLDRSDAARSEAELALKFDPANGAAVAVLVGYHSARNDLSGAIEVLDKSLRDRPKDQSLRILKISLLLKRNRYEAAASEYRKLVSIDPKNSGYVVELVKLLVRLGKTDEGERLLRAAVDRDPGSPEKRLQLVDFLANQRSLDVAQETLLGYVEKFPDVHQYRFALANLYRRGDKRADAYRVLRDIGDGEGTGVERIRAKTALANLLFIDGDTKQAFELSTAVLKSEPGNVQALLLNARIAISEKRYDRAIEYLRQLLRNDPTSSQALRLLSHSYLESGNDALAIDALQRLLEAHPNNDTRLELSQLVVRRGDFGSALKLLEDALARNPRDIRAHATKVDVLVMQGRLVAAQMAIQDIQPLPGSEAVLLRLRGRIALAERRWADAEKLYSDAWQRDPKSYKAALGLAQSLAGGGKIADAAEVLERAAKAFPGQLRIRLNLAAVLGRLKRSDEAKAVYLALIEDFPKRSVVYIRLSRLHAKLGERDEQVSVLERGFAAIPSDLRLPLMLARALQESGRMDNAIDVYERALQSGSGSIVVANNFGALVADHRFADMEALKRALKYLAPHQGADNAHVADTIGWLHYRLGSSPQAIAFLKRALAVDPANANFNYHVAMAYAAEKQSVLARKHFKIALAGEPDSQLAQEIQQKLKKGLVR